VTVDPLDTTGTQEAKEKAREEIRKMMQEKRAQKAIRGGRSKITTTSDYTVVLNGLVEMAVCLESGADANIVPQHIITQLLDMQPALEISPVRPVTMVDGHDHECRQQILLD
jgi:hypothetical protein